MPIIKILSNSPEPFFRYTEYMGITFSETPVLFGKVHLFSLFLILLLNLFFYCRYKDKKEKELIQILHRLGLIMLICEIWKQWFCYIYVFDHTINLWFFPWQLCSMAMYCSFLVSYLDEKKQNCVLVFLSTFSLFTDLIALALPLDMLRDQILLTIHSFAYHGLILSQAILAIRILRQRKGYHFYPSIFLFLFMAMIAEIINVVSHFFLHDIHREPDMFYITLSYPTTQPVFHEIALHYGIFWEIIIYLSSIILASYLLFVIERKFFCKDHLE